MKIIVCVNAAWNLVNFRSGLIRSFVEEGHEVVAVAPEDGYANGLEALGCRFVAQPMDNMGTHPVRDFKLFLELRRLLKRERPDVYMAYTVKPNIYGSLAARSLGIPVVNNITGLGAAFIRRGWVTRVVTLLYRVALRRSTRVFFQNNDDRQLFLDRKLVPPGADDVLPGSGVDLKHYAPAFAAAVAQIGRAESGRPFRFLLVARMLWDKGIGEYAEAAQLLRDKYPDVEFCLLGFLDAKNPEAISKPEMDELTSKGLIYLGVSDDVRTQLREADCVVLPSYREGTPRTLLEAAAMAKPIVTTDAVGCREAVDDEISGFLCEPRSAESLAEALERVLLLPPAERLAMGRQGRVKMERQFDERFVVLKYMGVISALASRRVAGRASERKLRVPEQRSGR